jgi:hypothetical protein
MEDDKKMSTAAEEIQQEIVENVQQEAESQNETMETESEATANEAAPVPPEPSEEVPVEIVIPTEEVAVDAIAEETQLEAVKNGQQEAESQNETIETESEATASETAPAPPEPSEEVPVEVVIPAEEVVITAVTDEPAPKPANTPEGNVQSEEAASNEEDTDEDEEDHHEENIYLDIDLEGADKKKLLDWLIKISKEDNIRKIDRLFKDLGTHFEAIFEEEKKSALEEFLALEGNQESDFEYKGDETDKEFNSIYESLRHKRSHFYSQLNSQKEDNLARKTEILDLIRESVDGEDQTSFNKVKKLQEEWKRIGQVPGAQNRTLWANYHALMDRFYDQRSIYFELKELDRKKNLVTKIEIVERAEALDGVKDVKGAIVALNELHDEFKHVGPVPQEEQEPLWQRFKAASDKVYDHRKEYTEQQKEVHTKNLVDKTELANKMAEFAEYNADRIKDWNQKTKQLLELQKQWEAIGTVPRDKAKVMNKAFWGNFKVFFANKSKYFKSLDAERDDNLKKKRELVEQAKVAKESEDWEATTKLLKNLQNEWKELGPVPEKFRKSIYEEFKKHCDAFFNTRRGLNAEQDKEFGENLNKKMAILNTMEELSKADPIDIDEVFDNAQHFSSAGMVPRNSVGKTLARYDKVAKTILASPSLSEDEVAELKMHFEICKLRNSPHGNQKINRKENILKRKVTGLENDISTWNNNLDFFAASKNADQLKSEFLQKIEAAKDELEQLKQQLRLMRD